MAFIRNGRSREEREAVAVLLLFIADFLVQFLNKAGEQRKYRINILNNAGELQHLCMYIHWVSNKGN